MLIHVTIAIIVGELQVWACYVVIMSIHMSVCVCVRAKGSNHVFSYQPVTIIYFSRTSGSVMCALLSSGWTTREWFHALAKPLSIFDN